MLLTEPGHSKARLSGTDRQIADGGGLPLVIRTKGAKMWRYEFRLSDEKNMLAPGNYPEISLAKA